MYRSVTSHYCYGYNALLPNNLIHIISHFLWGLVKAILNVYYVVRLEDNTTITNQVNDTYNLAYAIAIDLEVMIFQFYLGWYIKVIKFYNHSVHYIL